MQSATLLRSGKSGPVCTVKARVKVVMVSGRTKQLVFARGLALSVILCLGYVLGPTVCRADPQTHYLRDRTFEIPYEINAQQSFNQLLLHVSTDGKNYSHSASVKNRKGVFTYTATSDGLYYFIVQLEDASGVLKPDNLQKAIPTVRVIVDTEKPVVTLRAVQPRDRRAAVEWKIEDRNPDLRTLILEAKGQGETTWTPLKTDQMQHAQFSWDPPTNGPYEVRLTISDLAGNLTTATTQVMPLAGGGAASPGESDNRPVIYVKHKRFKLTYKIDGTGPSNIKHVEVWMTRDRNQWQLWPTKAPAAGPFEITVLSTGRYGFTLRPISGVGRGKPAPQGGALPQIWVEVDETPPEVQIHNVTVGEGADAGKIIITWRCVDKFLKDKPITIQFKAPDASEWKTLQENIENTGIWKVAPPEGVFEFLVRIEAIDKAGNKGVAQSKEAIKVDLAEPSARDINIQVPDATAPPPQNTDPAP